MRTESPSNFGRKPDLPDVWSEGRAFDAPDSRTLSVVFVPYWGGDNPYQDALVEHLAALGVQVEKVDYLKDLFRWGILLHERPDIVHLHWLPMFRWRDVRFLRCLVFVWRLLLLRLYGIPLVWTIHNLVPHESRHPRMDWLLARIVIGLSSGLIVHGDSGRRLATANWQLGDRHHFAVIPHGNYMEHYPDTVDRATARRKLALDDSELAFLFLGAVRPYKGILELLEAFRRVAPSYAVLLIAGQPLDEEFRCRVDEIAAQAVNIRFYPGFVPDEQVQIYMNAADAVVLPYRRVLSSGAALLAMSFGKPCVAPADGCLSDVLDDSGAFLYDPEDPSGLPDSLRHAVEARDSLAEMGQHNRRKASPWTWEQAARATRALYRHCLSGLSPSRYEQVDPRQSR